MAVEKMPTPAKRDFKSSAGFLEFACPDDTCTSFSGRCFFFPRPRASFVPTPTVESCWNSFFCPPAYGVCLRERMTSTTTMRAATRSAAMRAARMAMSTAAP